MSYRKDRLISAEEIEIQPVTGLLVSGMVLLAPMLPASGKPPPPHPRAVLSEYLGHSPSVLEEFSS